MVPDVQKAEVDASSPARPALTFLAKIKELAPIVLVVCACGLVFEGILVRYFITDEWIDNHWHITDFVRKNLMKAVDSGYSGTLIFHNRNTSGDASIEFFSRENQKVSLYVKSVPVNFADFRPKLIFTINGAEIPFGPDNITDGLPNTKGGGLIAIDSILKETIHGEIHTFKNCE